MTTDKITYANMGHVCDNEYKIHEFLNGELVAEYRGFWKPKKRCWLLYPAAVKWKTDRCSVTKKEVDERKVLISIGRR